MLVLLITALSLLLVTFGFSSLWVLWLRPALREAWLERQLFSLFALMVERDDLVDESGIESDWLAMKLCGLPVESRIKRLPAEAQVKVIRVSEEVTALGAKLVKRGLLKYMAVTFENQGKNQIIKSPRSLFMLTAEGRARVLSIRASRPGGIHAEA
jgi:hypothetical protein